MIQLNENSLEICMVNVVYLRQRIGITNINIRKSLIIINRIHF